MSRDAAVISVFVLAGVLLWGLFWLFFRLVDGKMAEQERPKDGGE